jgi:hypothetical protein
MAAGFAWARLTQLASGAAKQSIRSVVQASRAAQPKVERFSGPQRRVPLLASFFAPAYQARRHARNGRIFRHARIPGDSMKTIARIAAAFAAGAALMYYFDPQGGRRRRALARDRGVAAGHDAQRLVRSKTRRAADRTRGALARARAALSNAPVSDDQLRDRIRARLGHLVEHPGQLNVDVQNGFVVLRGHAEIDEIEELSTTLPTTPCMVGVDNRVLPEDRRTVL